MMNLGKLHESAIDPVDNPAVGTIVPADSRLDRIQIGRGIACMAVVFFHTGGIAAKATGIAAAATPFAFGYIGVDFFFVLSGFILTWVHLADLGHRERLVDRI
jgi:exopolysaccharide production protein ExoZ